MRHPLDHFHWSMDQRSQFYHLRPHSDSLVYFQNFHDFLSSHWCLFHLKRIRKVITLLKLLINYFMKTNHRVQLNQNFRCLSSNHRRQYNVREIEVAVMHSMQSSFYS